ncbi:MAG: serine/threonine-protein kinase [Planctomycetaceae bacterium]
MSFEFAMSDPANVVRENYRNALQAEMAPRIEDFLAGTDDSELAELFRDCMVMELNFCRQRGIPFDKASVEKRFPQFLHVLEEVFRIDADSANDFLESTTVFKQSDPLPDSGDRLNASSNSVRAGRYRLDKIVGRGGFGEVWKAYDPDLDRFVAVKIPRADRQFSPELLESFLAEARCVAKLRISGIVPVYDVGQEGNSYYIVSDFVDGETLADRIKRERLSWRDSALLLAEVAETLHRAHLKDLVHRDIKPNNILLDRDGRAFVADFGLAVTEGQLLQESPSVLGTFAYMSPEQARGDSNRVDARADIYSLGVMMYQLLTNRLPFLGTTATDYLQQIKHRDARPPRTVDDTIPIEMERICLKCLSKSASDRYSTAKDLAADLRKWLDSSNIPVSAKTPNRKTLAISAVVLAIVIVVAIQLWERLPQRASTISEQRPPASSESTLQIKAPEPNVPMTPNESSTSLTSQEQAWQSQLGELPREIIWPGYQSGGVLGFRPDLQSYEVIAEPVRLIQLGTLDSKSARLGITIEQPVWNGSVGLFLGYHELETAEGRVAQMQWIVGGRHQNPAGQLNYRIRRAIVQIPRSQPYPITIKSLGHADVAWPSDSKPVRLEIEFREGRFIRGSWGQDSLPFSSDFYDGQTTSADYVGGWGVFNHRATSWFRHPTRQLLEGKTP